MMTSLHRLQVLVQFGVYRHRLAQINEPESAPPDRPHPFIVIAAVRERTPSLLQAIIERRGEGSASRIEKRCRDLQAVVAGDADVALAAMRLDGEAVDCVAPCRYASHAGGHDGAPLGLNHGRSG